ncbi:6-phosphofructokinase [Gordonia malaquae]|uniref:ATP-dependent 6-phosphofructokinase n=1 Tax=Gordonia malaquae NBRC 108250 TaxID=1223542 RepID=M3VB40_GORML|nr:6-phosphofructokinase [Gordonia malaquae]GAC79598.1 6-phosphofructokinase [Gordonia malaquae NBRC 108250]SED76506.1 6-phosphofructokinase [Gordonia malaquae]
MGRFGILTSGGDCPGLNAVIRGTVLQGETLHDQEFVGYLRGYRGLVYGDVMPLDRSVVRGISSQGGTILGTSRFGPYTEPDGTPDNIKAHMKRLGVDGVIAIGGDGTMAAANRLYEDGIPVVGVPKTIDNDLEATDYTFGFNTAVEIATEAVDRLRTTGNSHKRCMVLEVMGRHAGWIAMYAGTAGGAHAILIPEQPENLDQICEWVQSVRLRGRSPMVVVAEGFTLPDMDEAHSHKGMDGFNRPRLGGIGEILAPLIEEKTGIETRATVLGHIQRGGVPSAWDRVLGTRFGQAVSDMVADQAWGQMVALRGMDIERVPFSEAVGHTKNVPLDQYRGARAIFG